MPALGALLTTLFGAVVAWFTQFVTRKVAYALTGIAMLGTMTAALFVAMRATLASLNGAMSGIPALFIEAVATAIPPVAPFCVSAYVTIWTATTAYRWQRDLIHLAMQA